MEGRVGASCRHGGPGDSGRRQVPSMACGGPRHRNATYARDLVVLSRLLVQRWQCKMCLGSVSPLLPGVTALQRPQAFRELVTSLYVYSVSLRGQVQFQCTAATPMVTDPGCDGTLGRSNSAALNSRRETAHRGGGGTGLGMSPHGPPEYA